MIKRQKKVPRNKRIAVDVVACDKVLIVKISLISTEGTTANHYDSPYSFSDSVYKRHAPNTLGTFDAEVNHNSQWTENCEDDSPQSSPESVTDSQTSMMDSMNVASSQLSGYGTDHMDASGTENLVVSQSETTANTSFMTRSQEVSPKVTSAVSKGTKRRQSQPSVSEDVKELTEVRSRYKDILLSIWSTKSNWLFFTFIH